MTQSPPLLKHPVGRNSPTPASSQTGLVTGPTNFTPRKEFLRDHRTTSSFSLLALSGNNLVRLYSFPQILIASLRRFFNQKDILLDERERLDKQFHEFILVGRFWAHPKNISSEKLIVDIFTIILHSGYAFLSTIDYGRESDDKLAIAFSRPVVQQNAPGQSAFSAMNSSVVSLNVPPRTPFAISFVSNTVVRVVGPPLHSTPAILTAVRGAWPRGVEHDKKVGDATYEFKLKGYKWFQEDTFPMDSLNHTLGLLTALDGHGFTLLTSLSFTKPSRVKDLWIFTGISEEQSPPPTPTTLTHEPKRDLFAHSIIPGPSPLSAGAEKRSSSRIFSPSSLGSSTSPPNGHARSASEQSPLSTPSQKVGSPPFGTGPTALLRKPSPKSKLPSAFSASKLNRSSSSGARLSRTGTPVAEQPRDGRPSPAQMVRSLSNPSSVGSVDMTGVGRRSMSFSSRTPDVFYVADGRGKATPAQEYNPFNASLKPNAPPPHAAFIKVTTPTSDRRASLDSRNPPERPTLRPTIRRSSTIPVALETRQESSSSIPRSQLPPPVATKASVGSERVLDKDSEHPRSKREPPAPLQLNERRRTPTPPLLTPGTFRDSAFSWATGKIQEVPIAWTGREPDPSKGSDRPVNLAADTSGDSYRSGNVRSMLHTGANGRPDVDRANSVPQLPGGWVTSSTPREEMGDVSQQSYKLLPATIREHPGQEADERRHHIMSKAATKHVHQQQRPDGERDAPYRSTERAAERGVEEVAMGTLGHTTRTNGSATTSSMQPSDSIAAPKPKPAKRDTAMSGWVMVNVEGAPASSAASSNAPSRTGKSSSQSPPGTRPNVRHRRSNSDSGLLRPQVSKSPVGNAPAPATMSAAAKTIVMMDAIDANKEEQEKSNTPSGLKRIFHRTKGTESDGGGGGKSLRRRITPDGVGSKGKDLERVQSDEKHSLKDKLKSRGTPPATKPGMMRQTID